MASCQGSYFQPTNPVQACKSLGIKTEYMPIAVIQLVLHVYLMIDRNFCSVHAEVTSIRLYTPCNQRSRLHNLIEVISNEPNK